MYKGGPSIHELKMWKICLYSIQGQFFVYDKDAYTAQGKQNLDATQICGGIASETQGSPHLYGTEAVEEVGVVIRGGAEPS